MSLENLMVTEWSDWDEIETGTLLLVNVRFTPKFSDFIWDIFGKAPDIGKWNLIHSFAGVHPVILLLGDLKFEVSVELFTRFLVDY